MVEPAPVTQCNVKMLLMTPPPANLQNLDMPELIEKARKTVIGHAGKLLQANHELDLDYLVLDLPCTFFMLRSLRWGTSGISGVPSR
jgi:hypothetical protein